MPTDNPSKFPAFAKLAPEVYIIFVNVGKKQEERELSRKLYVT